MGISERMLSDLLPELPHTRFGRAVVIPVKPLEEWLAARAKAEMGRADKAVNDVLRAVSRT